MKLTVENFLPKVTNHFIAPVTYNSNLLRGGLNVHKIGNIFGEKQGVHKYKFVY
jgi:hypothetical protein